MESFEEWQPPHPAVAGGMDVQREEISEWKLDKEGLAIKSCAVKHRDGSVTYGLIIARMSDDGCYEEPRNLKRVQLETIRDFIGFVLEDSEG